MFCRKELKLIYATVVLLLEAELLVNTKAMESQRSSNSISQNSDDYKSLELCTTRNQQRLGSVFGNFTRHHKKGHRRRTTTSTTSTQTTIFYTTTESVDDSSDAFTTNTYIFSTQSTILKLPKPLRLSSTMLDKDYTQDVHSIDHIFKNDLKDAVSRERHHSKHLEQIKKEILIELDDATLTKSLNKIKRLYRDSTASAINKLNNKSNKGGIFLTDNCTTVVAQIGTTAILHCEVSDITENTVTWIRRKDYSLLSVGLVTYSADSRFFSAHGRHVKDWALHIRFATSADAGYYECQVPTHPPTSIFFKLILVAAYAEIVGESEKIIHEGSMLKLVCVVKRSTEPPSYVFWYFENRMINYDLRNGIEYVKLDRCFIDGVSVNNGRQTSELIIGKAEPRHAGNYTCVPANAKAASVTVHVVQSETPAAMQHGNSSVTKTHIHRMTETMIALMALMLIIKEHYQEFG